MLTKGPTPAAAIEAAARKNRITANALSRAKRSLGVTVAVPNGAGAPTWSLPPG
jgi:hypothetical protein